MAELYNEGKKPTDETAEEIISRLEAKKNYIPSSERVRKEYAYALLNEYQTYVKDRSDKQPRRTDTKPLIVSGKKSERLIGGL